MREAADEVLPPGIEGPGPWRSRHRSAIAWFAIALAVSGAAALIDQVVWQRALARYLGGVESHSAMVVVLVFMFGLGAGSLLAAEHGRRAVRPLLWLAALEAALAVLGIGVRALAGADSTTLIASTQGALAVWGVPRRLVYALSAVAVLLPPCLVMGATLPFAAEAAERALGLRSTRTVPLLFAINTLGSVAGALSTGWLAMPLLGYQAVMLVAICLNGVAVAAFLACDAIAPAPSAANPRMPVLPPAPSPAARPPWAVPLLAAALGFLSLGYEMLLLRITALAAEPRPQVFASVLGLYLLGWGLGCLASALRPAAAFDRQLPALAWCLFLVVSVGAFPEGASAALLFQIMALAWAILGISLKGRWAWVGLCVVLAMAGLVIQDLLPLTARSQVQTWVTPFVPCVLLGAAFGILSDPRTHAWGAHAGLVAGANTFGSCLGLTSMTLVLFDGLSAFADLVALGSLALILAIAGSKLRAWPKWLLASAGVITAFVAVIGSKGWEPYVPGAIRVWSSSEGVIAIDSSRNLQWNGLWHSQLSEGRSHLGTSNWLLAVLPAVLAPSSPRRCAVIGLGTGISAATMAKLDTVERVDCLEINPALADLHRAFPAGTLHCLDNPKVRMIWEDARLQLAGSSERYDLVMTQPLYLKQAGSAYLNSREFFTLVRDHLTPDGVFCLYSNGTPEQALAMRQTARQVFPCMRTCQNGYILLLSRRPTLGPEDAERIQERILGAGMLRVELQTFPQTATAGDFVLYLDEPPLYAEGTDLVDTDDTDHLEYPSILSWRVARAHPGLQLPTPLKPGRRQPVAP